MDPENVPSPFKRYPGVAKRRLPRQLVPSTLGASWVLSGAQLEARPLGEDRLATLLFLAGGVTRTTRLPDGEPVWFRASMSAGNLHPVELYVVDSASGVQHYDPLDHALVTVRPPIGGEPAKSAGRAGAFVPGATLVLTGVLFRTCWKYGERGWRHVFWDAGTLLANLLAAADGLGVRAEVVTAFADAELAELVGVDGVEEVPIAAVHLGEPQHELSDVAELRTAAPATAIAARVVSFPLADAAQRAGNLRRAEVEPWSARARSHARRGPAHVEPPLGRRGDSSVETVVLQRGSARIFRHGRAPRELLSWALAAATRPPPLDIAAGGSFLEHFVNVHDVEGYEPGAYRLSASAALEPAVSSSNGDTRALSAHLCLDQARGGDSSFTAFHCAELGVLLGGLGARGYRFAQLEAGWVAGRLALAATALGASATGLTFFDEQTRRAFGTDASPMLASAVGLSAGRPLASGTPGEPVTFRHVATRNRAR
jgi:SagB-type dehydrogenase family enzyme